MVPIQDVSRAATDPVDSATPHAILRVRPDHRNSGTTTSQVHHGGGGLGTTKRCVAV